MVTDQNVRLLYTTQEMYNNLEQKSANTLYFIIDTRKIYKGGLLFSNNVNVVTKLPTLGIDDCLYILKGLLYYWSDGNFHQIITSSKQVIPGKLNQFILSDGNYWAKNSGLVYTELHKSVYESFPPASLSISIKPKSTESRGTITRLLIRKINKDGSKNIIYNLSTDTDLSSLLTGLHSYLYITAPTGKKLADICSINNNTITLNGTYLNGSYTHGELHTIPRLSSDDRYIIETTSSYETDFYINSTKVITNTGYNDLIVLLDTSNYFSEKGILDLGEGFSNQFVIREGDNSSIDNGYYFAISDKSRLTLHNEAKADITGTSQLYLHDDSKLHVDHDSTLFFHKGYVNLDGYGDGELSQTYDYSAHHRFEGRCTDNGPNLFFHDYAFLNMCNDAAFEMKDNSYLNLVGNGWLDVNSSTIHLNNHSGIKLDNMAVLDLSTRSTLKMNYDGYPDGPAPAIICDPDGFTYISKGSYGNSGTWNDRYTGVNSALFRTDPVGRDPQSMVPSNKDTSIQIHGETIVTIDSDEYSSTYIKISGDKNDTTTGDNPQACIILTGNIFQQMSGNSHMEMHDDSKLIMRGSNPYKEPDFYGNYPSPVEQGNNGPIVGLYSNPTITIGSINKNPKTVNYNVNITIHDEDATSEITTYEDFSESGKQKIFNVISNPEITQINSCTIVSCTKNETNGYDVVLSRINYNIEPREQSLGTTTFSGTRTPFSYTDKNITGNPTNVLELTEDSINLIIEQLGFSKRISDIQITGGTIKYINTYYYLVGIENLTYTCTINPYILHLPKKENNPYIEILNNSQIIMSGDAKVEADSNNLKFNDQCVAFNYVINSGQPTENTVTIESLYSSLQSALERITYLENKLSSGQ